MPDWHWRKDWGEEAGPGEEQRKTIDEKIRDVSDKFGISRDKIFTVSASEEYHIEDLSEHLIKTMPKEKRLGLAQNYRDYLSSSKTIWRWVVEGVQATLRSVAEKHGADIRDRLIDAALKALMGAVAAYFGFAAQL